jgi:hypothetical protein
MLLLTQGKTDDQIVVTLTEKATLTDPYYLFVFEHFTTKEIVRFVAGPDQSLYPARFNAFAINTASLFANASVGQWSYKVYEQASAVNTDEAGLNEVENGRMRLDKSGNFSYQQYEPSTNYKAYGG